MLYIIGKQAKLCILPFFFMLVLFSCTNNEQKIKIGYVQITQDPVLDAAKVGLLQALTDSGFIDGKNVKIIDNNANGDLSMIVTILQSFQTQGVDMIITNSTPCMVAAAQIVRDIPVVFTVSFSPDQVQLKTVPDNLYGAYDPFDTESFVSLVMEAMPGIEKVGLPYNNAESNAEYSAKELKTEFTKRGIAVITTSINSPNDIFTAGQYLADKRVDALIAAADNTVYLGLNSLAKVAEERKIPLFVTDPIQVEKGAAIGLGVNYERWGYLSGLKAIDLLRGRTVRDKIEAITERELIVNMIAAEKQGLMVTPEIVEIATTVIY
jgi:putative tryptophan/tyrosine transport system substrate-binding protein